MNQIPCLASRWADEYSDMQDARESKLDALTDSELEDMARVYLEDNFPGVEFDTEDAWHQWIADNHNQIIQWSA